MYDYKDLNKATQGQTRKAAPSKKDSEHIFRVYFHTSFRVVILIQNGYKLDLTEGDFAALLSYDKKVHGTANNTGGCLPNITRGVDWVFIRCDCLSRKMNNVANDVLFAFSTSELRVSYRFSIEPIHLEWHPVSRQRIDWINIRITEGRNGILN